MAASQLRLDEGQKRVMRYLRMHGPTSRSGLSSYLQVSSSELTKLSRSLLSLGLVEEVDGDASKSRGRPAVPLRIAAAGGYAVGATVHKGMISIALVNYAGGTIAQVDAPFDNPDPGAFASAVRAQMKNLADKHHLLGARLLGVGVGIPGFALSPDAERWLTVESLSKWRDVSLRYILEDELGAQVWMENDANAAALAEFYLGGLAPDRSNIVVILLGYGIGGGVITDGKLLKGQFGNAGEIGALYPVDQPRPSTVDLFGFLREHGCEINSITDFENLTRDHQDVIDAWVVRAGKQLELFVNGAVAWFDPGALILSSSLPHKLLARLAAHLNTAKIAEPRRLQLREVTVSSLGGDATTLGAALLPIHAVAQF